MQDRPRTGVVWNWRKYSAGAEKILVGPHEAHSPEQPVASAEVVMERRKHAQKDEFDKNPCQAELRHEAQIIRGIPTGI
jgi:hypothetical protein